MKRIFHLCHNPRIRRIGKDQLTNPNSSNNKGKMPRLIKVRMEGKKEHHRERIIIIQNLIETTQGKVRRKIRDLQQEEEVKETRLKLIKGNPRMQGGKDQKIMKNLSNKVNQGIVKQSPRQSRRKNPHTKRRRQKNLHLKLRMKKIHQPNKSPRMRRRPREKGMFIEGKNNPQPPQMNKRQHHQVQKFKNKTMSKFPETERGSQPKGFFI